MKRIKIYVNTTRVHWLVEEFQKLGIEEIFVREYFSPNSQISCLELLCQEHSVESVRKIAHTTGTNGGPVDHFFHVEDFDASNSTARPPGHRMSPLDE